MATNKKKAGKAQSRAKSTAKKPASKKAGGKQSTGAADTSKWDSKVPANAADTNPDMPVSEAIADAGRRLKEAERQTEHLGAVPTFDSSTVAALKVASTELERAEAAWGDSRRSDRSKTMNAVATNARSFATLVLNTAKFLFRDDDQMLERLSAIAAGEGLADLIEDLDAIGKIVSGATASFDAVPSTRGAVPKLADFRQKLLDGSDSTTALTAQKARNLAFWRLDYLSDEVYRALLFVCTQQGIDPKRVVNLRGYDTRLRASQRRKKPSEPATT